MPDYNNKERIKISTNSITFFNEEHMMLKIVYLEDALTVSINIPQILDGKISYPQELRHSVLINQNNISAIHSIITDKIIPAYEAGNNKDAGVFTNRNKSQIFEVAVQNGNFYAYIHDEVENRIPKNTYEFKFDKTQIICDYDVKTVSFTTEDIDAQFLLFSKAFEAFELLSNGITAHEYQYRQSYFIDQLKKLLNALDSKFNLGISQYKNSGYANNNKSGFNNNFDTQNPSPVEVREGTMNDLFSPDEIPFN